MRSNRWLFGGVGAFAGPTAVAIEAMGGDVGHTTLLLQVVVRALVGAGIGYGFGWWMDARRATEPPSRNAACALPP